MINTRSRVAVLTAAMGAAIMMISPAAQADTSTDKAAAPGAAATIVQADLESAKAERVLKPYRSRFRSSLAEGKSADYRFTSGSGFWSVVAVAPNATGDVDLRVYDDPARTQLLGQSTFGTGLPDFVAVDGNHHDAGEDFATVNRFGGTGGYYAEFAKGKQVLTGAPAQIFMMAADTVTIFDTVLVAGVTYTFTLTPDSGALTGTCSSSGAPPATPTTWARGRASSLATSDTHGIGEAESFTFTPTVTDRYGVVVISSGFGEYTLSRTS